ncbi:hypothetical protein GUJ93_ZPchr0011g28547 [Zizania palustris]|uniref:Uncharacterized protein n=1 Tax=Zizania palustris TaxID=103762 RepID=A0A8J5WHQ0_ZIZPA|nr:hypothetical protein GUJ93_ZPchr0011g28547 [Zizania palustris]
MRQQRGGLAPKEETREGGHNGRRSVDEAAMGWRSRQRRRMTVKGMEHDSGTTVEEKESSAYLHSFTAHDLNKGQQRDKEYVKFHYTPMENLDELEVLFQNIHVSGLSSIIPGGCENTTSVNIDDDIINIRDGDNSNEGKTMVVKRKGGRISPIPNKKKSPMIKEVKHLVDAIASSNSVASNQNENLDNEIIEQLHMVVKCGAKEGSDEHYIATKLFIKQEYRVVFRSFETEEGRIAWLKRMYENRKK